MTQFHQEVVGLIPAGGYSRRISPIPCSKEIYPIGYWKVGATDGIRPKVACHYLLEKMEAAGIEKVYLALRQGKWDIPTYLGNGRTFNLSLAYVVVEPTSGPPFTLDQAYPFVKDSVIAFGFPDIIFDSRDAFVQLLNRYRQSGADIVLGLFSIDRSRKDDRVVLNRDGVVGEFLPGPIDSKLRYTWNVAVWSPRFTEFMHGYVEKLGSKHESRGSRPQIDELTVGRVIKAAFDEGFKVHAVAFPKDPCIDIGTPADMARAVKRYA